MTFTNIQTIQKVQQCAAAARSDHHQYLAPEVTEKLIAIAPTVQLDDNGDLVTRLKQVAVLVGKQAEAQAWLDHDTACQSTHALNLGIRIN